jgi:hypothetical protein
VAANVTPLVQSNNHRVNQTISRVGGQRCNHSLGPRSFRVFFRLVSETARYARKYKNSCVQHDSSTTVTLSFTDDAPATVNIDMLLNNVRVTGGGSGSPTTLQ